MILDPVALAWVASSVIGALVSLNGIFEGRGDIRALGLIRNGRRMIANDYLRTNAGLLVVFLVWLALGLNPLFDANPTPLTPFTASLVGTNVLLTLLLVGSMRTRRALLRT